MEKSFVVINFPVSKHVYKYLQKKVGEKLVATRSDYFGSLVLDIISKKYYKNHTLSSELSFPVEIGFRYLVDYGIYLNTSIVKKFDLQVDNMFREEMIAHIEIMVSKDFERKEALEDFLHYYNIDEDDIKLETLLKFFDRKIKERKI